MEKVIDKFLRYVAVETTSDPESNTQPSTKCQLNLLKILANELNNMGIKASVDEFGYVMGTIPSNIGKKKVPAIGFTLQKCSRNCKNMFLSRTHSKENLSGYQVIFGFRKSL